MTTDRDKLREALEDQLDGYPTRTYEQMGIWLETNAPAILAAFSTPPAQKPWCETCGKDVHEILCPTCAKWWNDNPSPAESTTTDPEQAVMAERERCGRIVETAMNERFDCGDEEGAGVFEDCLAAIRARKEQS